MAYSLGLTLYNLKMRKAQAPAVPRLARPVGRLIWLHAAGHDSLMQMCGLACRLQDEKGLEVLLTSSEAPPAKSNVIWESPPNDSPADARDFLDHWQPDAAAFAEGDLRPALLHEAHERGIPKLLLDARSPFILKGREGWWPGLIRGLLSEFRAIHAIDESAARALRRAGAPVKAVKVVGRMEYPSATLPCTEAERAEMALLLATRPVWFVSALPEAEEAQVIAAHRTAMKLAHRLLLIVAPKDQARGEILAKQMHEVEGWSVAQRGLEQEPDPEVQVFIADADAEYGLWYRLAPITFLGGSLSEGSLRDPMEAAALGSAIIHGPKSGRFGASLGRLAAAQATALVSSSADLAEALSELLSPDRAARLAQTAWIVASDGAEATDAAVVTLCQLAEETR
ncbi:MAG: 3-deoxy-D-manno-octulosonic-acid transferase [Pseudorhodobacter sp.]|jgi:3-deoxy-D-manno-octulosonic-acid transferase